MSQASTAKLLTPAREAVMACLMGWKQWSEQIVTFVNTDDERAKFLQLGPQISRCPLVVASWDPGESKWWVYSKQELLAPMRVQVYVPADRYTLAEQLVEDAKDAIWRFEAPGSTDAGPVGLIYRHTCRDPEDIAINTGSYVELGQEQRQKFLLSEYVFRLSLRKDPKLRAQ